MDIIDLALMDQEDRLAFMVLVVKKGIPVKIMLCQLEHH